MPFFIIPCMKHILYLLLSMLLTNDYLIGQVDDPYILVGSKKPNIPIIITRYLFDFSQNNLKFDTSLVPIGVKMNHVYAGSANSSMHVVSDSIGVLFYSNGAKVLDSDYAELPGGSTFFGTPSSAESDPYFPSFIVKLSDSLFYQINSYFSFLKPCPNGGSTSCSEIFYQKIRVEPETRALSVIDRNHFVHSSKPLEPSYPVRHGNGRDWFFAHLDYTSFANPWTHQLWLIKPDSVEKHASKYTHLSPFNNHGMSRAFSQKGFSPDGSKYYWCDAPGCMLFDFDRCTGQLSNLKVIQAPPDQSINMRWAFSGANYSPSNRYFYLVHSQGEEWRPYPPYWDGLQINDYLLQYDTWAPNIAASVDTIAVSDSLLNPGLDSERLKGQEFKSLSYAPDGQLWMPSGYTSISILQYPDSAGQKCGFISRWIDGLESQGTDFRTVNHRLGPLDGSPCDTLGLNNDPKAQYFWKSNDCLTVLFRNTSWHEPTSFHWDFGDGTTSTDLAPTHTYPFKGAFTVCLIVNNQFGADTFCRDLDLYHCEPLSTQGIAQDANEYAYAQLFPNPTSGHTQLGYRLHPNRNDGLLRIYDMTGREVLIRRLVVHETSYLFSLAHLPAGLYFWSLSDGIGQISSGKVVKLE
jgi:hypothetical protein